MCEPVEAMAQHKWLQQLVGEWDAEGSCMMGPDVPDMKTKAREVIRPVGDLWIQCESTGDAPGSDVKNHSVITIGFDKQKDRFVGSFVCSMMTRMWTYEGGLVGNKLTLTAQGPSFTDPNKLVDYDDELELVTPDHKILRSYNREDPANPICFMTMEFRRVKQ